MSQTGAFLGFVHRRRRGAELFLLVLALAVGAGAYAAVGLGVEGTIPANMIGYAGWLAALVIAAHVVIRIAAPYADPVLLPVVAALNGLGLAVIHRLDLATDTSFARQQLIWMTLGVVLFILTLLFLRDHRVLQRLTYTLGLASILERLGDGYLTTNWNLAATTNLAIALRATGAQHEAATRLEEAMQASIRVLGAKHPNTIAVQEGTRINSDIEPAET